MQLTDFDCRVCSARELNEIAGFSELPRVSSDCKPVPPGGRLAVCSACGAVQKPLDERWRTEIDTIYRNYEPYFQSGGIEQAVFDPTKGIPRKRSEVVLDRLSEVHQLSPTGIALDVGCGNGVLLRVLSERRPDWRLFGHELSDLHAESLARIPGFERLFCGALREVPSGLDVITMMHALEHVPDPVEALSDLRSKLQPDGCLFVEVPNGEITPFDLVIADHVSHFTRFDLTRLFGRAGFGSTLIADDWVTKELSAVARIKGETMSPPTVRPAEALKRVQAQVAWLRLAIEGARKAAGAGRFGVFGTSIAAMWLFGELADEIAFFVDEDPSRRDATLFGRPVYMPDQVPQGASVYVLLIPAVARAVASRIDRPGIAIHIPPEVGASDLT